MDTGEGQIFELFSSFLHMAGGYRTAHRLACLALAAVAQGSGEFSSSNAAQSWWSRDEVAGAEKATYFVEAAFVSTPVSVVGDFRAPPPDTGAIGIL